jgi:tRNA A37 methylthiotransferase MiaB
MSNCPNAQFSGWEVIKKMLPGIKIVPNSNKAEVVIAYFCALTKDEIVGAKDTLIKLLREKEQRPAMKLIVGGCLLDIKTESNTILMSLSY